MRARAEGDAAGTPRALGKAVTSAPGPPSDGVAGVARGTGRGVLTEYTWLLRTVAVAALVAAVCLRSLLQHGYLLQVDSVYGPIRPLPGWGFYAPILLIEDALSHVIGSTATGRLYVTGALVLCVAGPMVLLRDRPWYAQCAGGLLGGLNPWVYDRIVEGQWGVAAGAGGLFLWVAAWEALQQRPRGTAAIRLAGLTVAIVALNESYTAVIGILLVAALLFTRAWRAAPVRRWTMAYLAMSALLLLYGVIPFFLGAGDRSIALLQTVGSPDFTAFRTTPSPRFGLLDLLGLYGYWGERLGRFPLADGGTGWWPAAALGLTGLALVGAVRARHRRWLLASGAVGLAVSASTAIAGVRDALSAASTHFSLLGALREPQKFAVLWLVALVVLDVEAISAPPCTDPSVQRRGQRYRHLKGFGAFAMVLATLLPAGAIQMRAVPEVVVPVEYPSDWTQAAAFLHSNVPPGTVVGVLPWHQYEALDFAGGRLVRNPASVIFPGNLLVPKDIEIPGTPSEIPPSRSTAGFGAYQPGAGCALADALRGAGARWVVVEDAPGGLLDADRLQQCGFGLVEGQRGHTVVLRS